MRKHGVLRYASLERGRERIDVVEPLSGEDALVEEILIRVRNGGGVRIDACVACVRSGEQRSGSARHRDADARLQDAVALGDAPEASIEPRPIQRMRDDADERLGCVARQARVRIERDAIAHRRKNVQRADLLGEARVGGASQQPVEFFDLAALPLPPDPCVFQRVPAPLAMKQEEPVGVLGAEPPVERLDSRPRSGNERRIVGQFARVGVGEVAEDRKMKMRVEVAEREHFDVLQQHGDRVGARQHRRHHDHRSRIVGNAVREIEARQPTRRNQPCDGALNDGNRDVGRRYGQKHEQCRDAAARGARVARVLGTERQQQGHRGGYGRQIHDGRVSEQESPGAGGQSRPVGDIDLEIAPSVGR